MQIIIPMSGFGERFRRVGYTLPKPLIEVEGKPIIEHVVEMFPGCKDFLFICNRDHLANPDFGMERILKFICPTGRIVAVDPHRKGPIHAVLEARSHIREDQETIVNYCDFTCYWDFAHFRRWVREISCDGAIPAYRDFHPHSLGSTFYAYLRESLGWASDIQEKRPFTQQPSREYASSGTYYFASGALMKWAFDETLRRDINVGGEYYASLAYVPLFEAQKRIAVYELQHFMQWGTPEDLAEYNQHSRTFRLLTQERRSARQFGAVLIPMAGAGARFAQAGYTVPKPMIEVSGQPMVIAAARDLPTAERHVFVLRHDLPGVATISQQILEAYPDAHLVMLEQLTGGQAETCLLALDTVDPDAPLTIGACDNGLLYDAARFEAMMADPAVDVIVWGGRGHVAARRKPKSYGWIDATEDRIMKVSVKEPLRDPANDPVVVGAFTFKRARDFKVAAERMIARDGRVNGEYYVDTCINDALAMGLNVRMFDTDAYLCWGTPDELKTFEYWQSCFHKWAGHPYTLSSDNRVWLDAVDVLEQRYAPKRPSVITAE